MKGIDPLIEQELQRGGTVVVPAGPRAAAVQLAFARGQLETGCRAWRTPDVIAYRGWLEREAHRAADAGYEIPRPLRGAEEWLLWREATAAAAADEGIDAPDGLADSLQRAARLAYEWEIGLGALRSSERTESRLLGRALEHLEARASALRAAGSHQLAKLLQGTRPARSVTFAGFEEQSAARRSLSRAWADAEIPCREHASDTADVGSVRTVRAADPVEELELAAGWCRERLQRHTGERLLVVVPDLARRRTEVLRVFRRVLMPQALLSPSASEPAAVVLEGGTPLAGEPIVRHALTTLRFLLLGAEAADVSAWLRAAFWTAPGPVERARLDAALRQVLDMDVAPLALLAALREVSGPLAGASDRLRAALEAALAALGGTTPRGTSSTAPLGEWGRRFQQALRALGWPGDRMLSSREQQSAARLAEVLGDLAAIGATLGPVAAGEALRTLDALVDRRTLAAPAGDAAVTLTGALADPVVRYDAIWIAGLHADAWPAPPELDPFIPAAAQRRAGIPGADGARTLAQARELLRRCRRAAAHLALSWPAREAQREYAPSPLLAELDAPAQRRSSADAGADGPAAAGGETFPAATGEVSAGDSLARRIRASRRIELFEDAEGEPWPARSALPSGTRAIEYQSRCPFRAYAELRLASVPLAAPRPGVGALERGRLLHRALELLWERLGGSMGLEAERVAGTLARRMEECVEAAGDETLPVPRDQAARSAQRRERRRAVQLLAELAALERQRPPFRVRATELRRSIEIEGAALEVRIDRLDELEDGSCAVFDYKTGRAASPDWLAERIANPQLLVYALAAGARVTTLAMVHLTPRQVAYRGMADRRDRLPRIDAPPEAGLWPRQIERWEEAIARLARAFLRGAAAADPLGDACATCHLHGFCRIADAAAAEPGERDPEPRDEPRDGGSRHE